MGPSLVHESGVLNDSDTGWHIRNGEHILRTWSLPRSDYFSYTHAGKPWFAWEWLSDVFMGVVHEYLGLNGIALWANFTYALVFTLLFWWLIREENNLLITLALSGIASCAATVHWLARPHLFTLLLVLIWYTELQRIQNQGMSGSARLWKTGWILPPVMLLWTNLHGGFVVGLILLMIFSLGNLLTSLTVSSMEISHRTRILAKSFAWRALACGLITIANPYGLRIHKHIFDSYLHSQELVNRITEFVSPDFHTGVVKFFELLLVVGIIILGVSYRRLNFIESGLILFWTHMALFSVRHVPLYTLMMVPILVKHLSQYLDSLEADQGVSSRTSRLVGRFNQYSRNLRNFECQFKGFVYPALATLVLIGICLNQGSLWGDKLLNARFDPERFPVNAAQFIEQETPEGNLFTTDYWGGYLIYRFHPRIKVFFDGRSDMYGRDLLKDYSTLTNLEYSWKDVLRKYQVSWILLPVGYGLATALKELPDWQVTYDDHQAIIFVKRMPCR
jgi:hypothetical protein